MAASDYVSRFPAHRILTSVTKGQNSAALMPRPSDTSPRNKTFPTSVSTLLTPLFSSSCSRVGPIARHLIRCIFWYIAMRTSPRLSILLPFATTSMRYWFT